MTGTKVTFVFEQAGQGFTESHYLATNSTDFSTELAKAISILPKRMLLCGKECSCTWIRLSDLSNPRRYRLEPVIPPALGQTTGKTQPAQVAIIAKLRDQNFTSTGSIYLRGLYRDSVNTANQINPAGDWISSWFPSYIAGLVAGQWCWKPRDLALQKKAIILTATQDAAGTVSITTSGDVFYGPFPSVIPIPAFISGCQGAALLNGQRLFLATDARTAKTVRRLPIFPYQANTGRITVNQPKLVQIATAIPEKVGEKKVGKILYQSVGRRRVLRVA